MFTPEIIPDLITKRFEEAIYGLRDCEISPIANIAGRSIKRVGTTHELLVGGTGRLTQDSSVTKFDLLSISRDKSDHYKGAIIFDIDTVLTGDVEQFQGDLVRTLAIADQFPTSGYERRLRRVYADALSMQKLWLEQMESAEQPQDPRYQATQELVRLHLGEARFFSDVGFEDWKERIVTTMNEPKRTKKERKILTELYHDRNHFLSMRQRFTNMNYEIALSTIGPAYITQWGEERRAQAQAANFVGISLVAAMEGGRS